MRWSQEVRFPLDSVERDLLDQPGRARTVPRPGARLDDFGIADDAGFVQILRGDQLRPLHLFRAGKGALTVCQNFAPLLRRVVASLNL